MVILPNDYKFSPMVIPPFAKTKAKFLLTYQQTESK